MQISEYLFKVKYLEALLAVDARHTSHLDCIFLSMIILTPGMNLCDPLFSALGSEFWIVAFHNDLLKMDKP